MQPGVELIKRTKNDECDGRFICKTAGICYDRENKSDKTDDEIYEQLKSFWNRKHYSVFEFLDFDFKIQLSIVALKQITRHWNSVMMVKSGRYCKEDKVDFYLPPSIKEEDVRPFVEEAMGLYRQLIESGIKAEDARYFLPQGLMTQMRFKFNLRDFLCSIYPQRHSKKAQEEIRHIVDSLMKEVVNNSSLVMKKFLEWYKNDGLKSVER